MDINEIKQALAEASKICAENKCSKCPLHKHDESTVYCPLNTMCERVNDPDNWDVDDWEKEPSCEPSDSERIEDLEARLAQAERERDAAINELRELGHCYMCKYWERCFSGGRYESRYGNPYAKCIRNLKRPRWEWRGIENREKEGEEKKMTQEQREKLIHIQGTIRGISYTEKNPLKADCFDTLQEEIDEMLKEDEKG